MNNIKFRGLRTDGKGWVEGNLFVPNKLVRGVYICQDTTMADFFPNIDKEDEPIKELPKSDGIALGHFYEVEPNSVGMSTGLTDKNGKEIFGSIDGSSGGDILTCYELKVAIVFEAGQFVGKHLNNAMATELQNRNWLQFTIIGNQYQQ